MKHIVVCIFSLLSFYQVEAQQEFQYTNFMFNKLAINPAYAGSKEVPALMAIYRDQWVSFDGAPKTQNLNFHMPIFADKVGFGVNLMRDVIGYTETYDVSMSYAYRFPIKDGHLALGLNASLRNMRIDWTQASTIAANDPALPQNATNKWLPNFGTGVYYHSDKFYVGLSVPNLLNNSIVPVGPSARNDISFQRRHLMLMGGTIIPMGEKVKFNPNILMKYVTNAPFDMDINASFIFSNNFTIGASYRLDDSANALFHIYVTPQLRLGAAYDFTLTSLRNFNKGSFEVLLGYDFNYQQSRLLNPRFFY